MAIVFYNQTECKICQKPITSESKIIAFPAWTCNTLDPMYFFNDAAFHKDCIENYPLGKKAIILRDKYFEHVKPKNRVCIVSDQLITNPDDYFFTGILTSDDTEAIYKYNFKTFNKKNIKNWVNKDDFLNEMREFKETGKWEDPPMFSCFEKIYSTMAES